MLEAIELPARVPDLDTGLADVDRDALPHGGGSERRKPALRCAGGEIGGGGEDGGQSSEARERGEYEDAGLCDALLRVSAAHTRLVL